MIDALKEEAIVNKVGGRFKLSALIQKRLVQLNQNARPLVDLPANTDKLEIVVQEILRDKIFLDASQNLRTVEDEPDTSGGPPEFNPLTM